MRIERSRGQKQHEFRSVADIGGYFQCLFRLHVGQGLGQFKDAELPADTDVLFNVGSIDPDRSLREVFLHFFGLQHDSAHVGSGILGEQCRCSRFDVQTAGLVE